MSKKIFGLLLVLCLVVGLLPVVALADAPKTASIAIMSDITVNLTEGGEAIYYKNSAYEAFAPIYAEDGETVIGGTPDGTCWTQTKSDQNDWNVKVEYPTGGVPTVTLKDAKMDMMSDKGTAAYKKKVDAETGEVTYTTSRKGAISMILPKSICDIKLVLQGDNYVDVSYGIIRCQVSSSAYFQNVTIVGENGGKLSGRGRTFNLRLEAGYNLTVDGATLDWAATGSGGEAVPMATKGGDITIKNSDITMTSENQLAITAEGKITITDSKVKTVSYNKNGSSDGSGSINGKKGVVITNSEVTAEGKNHAGIYGGTGGVEINSGKVTVTAGQNGIAASKEAQIKINGGTVEVTSKTKAFSAAPVLAAGVDGVAGASADDADFYDDTKYNKAYVKLGTDVQAPAGTTPNTPAQTTPAGTTSTTPAQTTPAGTTPAQTTPAGTTSTTPAGTQGNNNPTTGDSNIMMFSALLLVAAFGIVATVAFGKKNSIVE